MKTIMLKNSIRLTLAGFLFDGGDIEDVPDILKEMAEEYEERIQDEIRAIQQLNDM